MLRSELDESADTAFMFLNQVNFLWRDLGRADGRKAALLLAAPFLVFVVLALPAAIREKPVVAEHAELSGTGSSTGPQVHLRDSYRITITISGQADCSSSVMIGSDGFTPPTFPPDATTSQKQVATWDMSDLQDGLYTIGMSATGCGPWTVTLDRIGRLPSGA